MSLFELDEGFDLFGYGLPIEFTRGAYFNPNQYLVPIFNYAQRVLDHEIKLTRGALARKVDGERCNPSSPDACYWSATGALQKAVIERREQLERRYPERVVLQTGDFNTAVKYIERILPGMFPHLSYHDCVSLRFFNDYASYTDIIRIFRLAAFVAIQTAPNTALKILISMQG